MKEKIYQIAFEFIMNAVAIIAISSITSVNPAFLAIGVIVFRILDYVGNRIFYK